MKRRVTNRSRRPFGMARQSCRWIALRWLMFVSIVAIAPVSPAALVNYTFNFVADGESRAVEARAWVPDDIPRIRGFVFIPPGAGGDARGNAGNITWQVRARSLGFGVLGLRDIASTYWGTSQADIRTNFNGLLDRAASLLSKPELANAPVLIYGMSKGGWAATDYVRAVPERVIAYVADKGAATVAPGALSPAALATPGMFVAGEADTTVSPTYMDSAFQSWRDQGALTSFVVDWTRPHVVTNNDLRWSFLGEAAERRYPRTRVPDVQPGATAPLDMLTEADGWLGQVDQLEHIRWPLIARSADYPLPANETSWLPSQTAAMVYRAHNHAREGILNVPLDITAPNNQFGAVDGGGPIELRVQLLRAFDTLQVFHGSELLASYGPSTGSKQLAYIPRYNGIHTFTTIATHTAAGAVVYTSDFVTVATSGVTVPEPTAMAVTVLVGLGGFGYRWQLRRGSASC